MIATPADAPRLAQLIPTGNPLPILSTVGGPQAPTPGDPGTATTPPDPADPIVSTGAVPEPGTWLMMILGFGLIGFRMRQSSARRVASRKTEPPLMRAIFASLILGAVVIATVFYADIGLMPRESNAARAKLPDRIIATPTASDSASMQLSLASSGNGASFLPPMRAGGLQQACFPGTKTILKAGAELRHGRVSVGGQRRVRWPACDHC